MPKQKLKTFSIMPDEKIIGKIYFIRGEKVMFDRDLAELYGVETKVLNQAVKRNMKRFPDDFIFQLNKQEADIFSRCQIGTLDSGISSRSQIVTLKNKNLKSQIVTSSWGGARKLPYVFTEQGVAMLSAVLKSERAINVSIQIVRVFVKMRKLLMTHKELKEKIEAMENKYDKNFKVVFKVMAKLVKTDPKDSEMKVIGFRER